MFANTMIDNVLIHIHRGLITVPTDAGNTPITRPHTRSEQSSSAPLCFLAGGIYDHIFCEASSSRSASHLHVHTLSTIQNSAHFQPDALTSFSSMCKMMIDATREKQHALAHQPSRSPRNNSIGKKKKKQEMKSLCDPSDSGNMVDQKIHPRISLEAKEEVVGATDDQQCWTPDLPMLIVVSDPTNGDCNDSIDDDCSAITTLSSDFHPVVRTRPRTRSDGGKIGTTSKSRNLSNASSESRFSSTPTKKNKRSSSYSGASGLAAHIDKERKVTSDDNDDDNMSEDSSIYSAPLKGDFDDIGSPQTTVSKDTTPMPPRRRRSKCSLMRPPAMPRRHRSRDDLKPLSMTTKDGDDIPPPPPPCSASPSTLSTSLDSTLSSDIQPPRRRRRAARAADGYAFNPKAASSRSSSGRSTDTPMTCDSTSSESDSNNNVHPRRKCRSAGNNPLTAGRRQRAGGSKSPKASMRKGKSRGDDNTPPPPVFRKAKSVDSFLAHHQRRKIWTVIEEEE